MELLAELLVFINPTFPDPAIFVFLKSAVNAALPYISIPWLAGFVIVVPPVDVIVPATVFNSIPSSAELVELMLKKVAANVPVFKSKAWPLPSNLTSLTVSVPKDDPTMSFVLAPILKPLRLFPEFKVMVLPVLVRFGFVPLVVGNAGLEKEGTVTPAKLAKVIVPPCPKTFCPAFKVAAPVYVPEYTKII